MYYEEFTLRTSRYEQLILITNQVLEIAAKSGIQNGLLTVLTKHTTTCIFVNESLECLESDIEVFLSALVPE